MKRRDAHCGVVEGECEADAGVQDDPGETMDGGVASAVELI